MNRKNSVVLHTHSFIISHIHILHYTLFSSFLLENIILCRDSRSPSYSKVIFWLFLLQITSTIGMPLKFNYFVYSLSNLSKSSYSNQKWQLFTVALPAVFCCSVIVVQSLYPTLCESMDFTPGSPHLHYLLKLVQIHVQWVSDDINI